MDKGSKSGAPMKIGILVNEFNIRGGTHKQVHRLADYLLRQGHEVVIYTKYFDAERCYPGVEKFNVYGATGRKHSPKSRFFRLFVSMSASLRLAWRVAKYAEVVNIHDNGFLAFWLVFKILAPTRRIIWQINDLPVFFNVGASINTPNNFMRPLRRFLTRLMARNVDEITVNVTKNAARVKKYLHAPATVLYCGVDLRNTTFLFNNRRTASHINLVSTGVFFPYRNYETILRAQRVLLEQYNISSRLTIIGSIALVPNYADEIALLADQLNVDCRILGDVKEDVLIATYAESNIFLFLNIDQSWGLAVFEAMNLGLPVIVSESVGAVELLRHGFDSEVVNPKDEKAIASAVFNLYRDTNLYESRQRDGYAATLHMTWDKLYSERMEKILLN